MCHMHFFLFTNRYFWINFLSSCKNYQRHMSGRYWTWRSAWKHPSRIAHSMRMWSQRCGRAARLRSSVCSRRRPWLRSRCSLRRTTSRSSAAGLRWREWSCHCALGLVLPCLSLLGVSVSELDMSSVQFSPLTNDSAEVLYQSFFVGWPSWSVDWIELHWTALWLEAKLLQEKVLRIFIVS